MKNVYVPVFAKGVGVAGETERRSHIIQIHSFDTVPCVREEKKDNIDENKCEKKTDLI